MTDKIIAALKSLDPTNDNHWTNDGAPRLETVRLLSSNPGLSRETVNNAIPGFSRAVAAGAPNPDQKTQEQLAAEAADAARLEEEARLRKQQDDNEATKLADEAAAQAAQAGDTRLDNDDAYGDLTGPPLAELEKDTREDSLIALEKANDYLSRLLNAREEIVAEISVAQNAVAEAQRVCDEEIKSGHTLSPIQAYLASQVKQGQERGELRRTVQESGVDLQELSRRLSPSPLDVALGSRKRAPRLIQGD